MKKLTSIPLLLALLMSCANESQELIINEELNIANKDRDYLLESEVVGDLQNLGYTEIDIPPDYEEYLQGASNIRMFKDTEGFKYSVYIYEDPESDAFQTASNTCTQKWYSDSGDCKNDGSECEVAIEDGETVVSCCDDEV